MVATDQQTQPPANGARPKPRRPISEEKRLANVLNGQKSTGPRSDAGKAVAALNAVTHGMTSNTLIFLDGENPDEFFAEVNRWAVRLGAATEAEYANIEMAVYNLWKVRRARNSSAAAVNKELRRIRLAYQQNQERRLEQLLSQFDLNPEWVTATLHGMTHGLAWLLFTLEQMAKKLDKGGSLDDSETRDLIRFLGDNPGDLCTSPAVLSIHNDSLVARHGTGTLTVEKAVELLSEYRPAGMTPEEFAAKVGPELLLKTTAEAARGYLKQPIVDLIDRAKRLAPVVEAKEEAEIAEDVAHAKSDVTPAGYRRQQYETTSENRYHRAMREFYFHQNERRKRGDDGSDEPEALHQPGSEQPGGAEPADATAAPDPAPAGEESSIIEPTVPQRADGSECCDKVALQPEPPVRPVDPDSWAALQALAAEYKRKLAEEEPPMSELDRLIAEEERLM
jgi:hypothetical protein